MCTKFVEENYFRETERKTRLVYSLSRSGPSPFPTGFHPCINILLVIKGQVQRQPDKQGIPCIPPPVTFSNSSWGDLEVSPSQSGYLITPGFGWCLLRVEHAQKAFKGRGSGGILITQTTSTGSFWHKGTVALL